MRTRINFDTDPQLKSEAEKKARKQGTSLSTVLNEVMRAFVEEQIVIGIDSDFADYIARARADFEESAWNF